VAVEITIRQAQAERAFSEGDRIQFTAPNRDQHVANRELGTIEKVDEIGNLRIRLDSGRAIAFNVRENPHLDHGYAVTSHSSQGQTADRVLIHVDTEQGGEKFVNRRLAYVAVSRGRYDAPIYTNDKTALAEGLGRDVSRRSALESTRAAGTPVAPRSEPTSSLTRQRERTIERDPGPGR
jgi:ATP-dependent exoDNAse (exonuclease V) alpha subunit